MKSSPDVSSVLTGQLAAHRSGGALPPLVLVPCVSMLTLLIAWLLAPAVLDRLMYLPLLLSTVLLGIPHGSLDHLIPGRLGWAWGKRRSRVALYLFGYLLLAVLVLVFWNLYPGVTYWCFLLVSLLHWGQGDLHYLETVQKRRRTGPWSAPLTLLTRGSLPILLPLLAFPDWFTRLAAGVHQVFGLPTLSGPLLPQPWPSLLTWALALLLIAYAADTVVSSRRPVLELGESGLLLLVFVVVPAPLSIGTYFSLWHAWRHLGRLIDLPGHRPAGRGPAAALSRSRVLHLAADLTPITLIALGMLAGLYLWAAPQVHSLEMVAALYLALIAALTLPHALLVAAMDALPAARAPTTSAAPSRPEQPCE